MYVPFIPSPIASMGPKASIIFFISTETEIFLFINLMVYNG